MHPIRAWFVAGPLVLCLAAPAHAEEPTPPPPMVDPAALARLKDEAGNWDVAVTLWFRPGAPPVTGKASMKAALILGGMYLEQRTEGKGLLPGMPELQWTTISLTGHNPSTQQYEVVRLASSQSTMIVLRGAMRADGSSELHGEYTLMGTRVAARDVTTRVGPDERRIESWMKFGDTPEFKGAELVLKRRK